MAAALATLKLNGGKFQVIIPGQAPQDFGKDFEAANKAAEAYNAQLVAGADNGRSVTGKVRCRLTYRGEFQVVPRGQSLPAITTTADVMEALITDWSAIVATFNANRSKVAANYQSKGKSVGQENAKLQPKIDLEVIDGETVSA
jgi:hypothetical protein